MNPYCDVCKQEHGPFYICEHYPAQRKAQIKEAKERFRANLYDPKWIKSQNAPPEVIEMYRIFMGGADD